MVSLEADILIVEKSTYWIKFHKYDRQNLTHAFNMICALRMIMFKNFVKMYPWRIVRSNFEFPLLYVYLLTLHSLV